MKKIIRLRYCEFCRKPVRPSAVRRFESFSLPLCRPCYRDYLKGMNPSR